MQRREWKKYSLLIEKNENELTVQKDAIKIFNYKLLTEKDICVYVQREIMRMKDSETKLLGY